MIIADLVVASAGEDKKISLWRKNGQSMGTIPIAGTDTGDNIEVISLLGPVCHQIYNALLGSGGLNICKLKYLHFFSRRIKVEACGFL